MTPNINMTYSISVGVAEKTMLICKQQCKINVCEARGGAEMRRMQVRGMIDSTRTCSCSEEPQSIATAPRLLAPA